MAAGKKTGRFVLLALLVIAGFIGWQLFGSNTNFDEKNKALYIKTGSSFEDVIRNLEETNLIKNVSTFKLVAKQLGYPEKIKAGRYVIEKGASIFAIIKKLRAGRQDAVNLVITKLRTKEDLAKKISAGFEADSTEIITLLNSNDSLKKYDLDTNIVMTAVIPNTYSILWNTPATRIFKKLVDEQKIFWNEKRTKQAADLKLTPVQVYIIASIIEEETNKDEDKGKIASVYMNRMATGMRLGADPTIKFAMKNFALKRIYQKYLLYPSPYNTYLNAGLPPGPICTPSSKTIDAVLAAPTTTYLYFVAKPEFDGYSNFASSYDEHLRFAKAYQQALDTQMKIRAESEQK